jgi:hypothetical protein
MRPVMKKKGNITSEHWFIPLVPSFQNFPKSKNLLFQFFEEIQNLGTAHCSSGLFWDFQN